jgi:ABC-type nitrate/sulfonate/bicarbonate transport system substrate-binding protein
MSAKTKATFGVVLAIGLFFGSLDAALAAPTIKIGNVSMAYTLHLDSLPALAKAEGLEVEVIDFKSSSDENLALAAGSLDGGNVGALGTNVLLTKGVPVMIVAGTVRGGSGFVVAKSIQSLQELQGKRIGATKGSTSEMLAKYQFKKAGVSVTWVNLPHPQLGVALAQKEVDAMAAGEPWASLAVSRGIGKNLPGFNIYDSPAGKVSGAFVVSQKLIREDPAAVQKLINALVKAVRQAETKREDYIKHAVSKLNVSAEEVRVALQNADISYELYPAEWPALTGIAKDMGYIQDTADYTKAFDLRFLGNATR